jgi:nitrite reductase/ring-hydroxylating ferredoxin subunit
MRLGPVDAIPLGEGRAFAVGEEQVAVFRLRDGTLRATQARRPRAGSWT